MMRYCQLSLIVVALVVPFGLFERDIVDIDGTRLQLMQSCPDEIGDFSETDAEELESYLHDVQSVEPHARWDSRLAIFRSELFSTFDVDPLGRRPPPCVRIS